MAVTFSQQPTTYTIQASDTPIIYVFSGSNYLQPNFCFIIETLIDNAVVSTDMIFPEVGSRGHIDISQTTLPQFRAALRNHSALYTLQNFSTAYIRVAERFGPTGSVVTGVFYNSNVCKIMKASCENDKFAANWITTNYPPSSKWLTDLPLNSDGNYEYQVARSNGALFSILNSDPNIIIGITLYDADDNPIYIDSYNLGTTADRVNFAVNPYSLAPVLLAASLTIADVFMVEMQMNGADSMFVRFIVDDCDMDQQISWLNNLGSYDQMLFSHNREVKKDISTLDYEKQFGNWSGNSFVHDKLNSGETTYVKEITPKGSLYTTWLTESYRNWLNQIPESIDVQLITNGVFEKITVTNSNTEELKTKYEEIISYQIDYRKTNYKSITQ